MSRDVLELAQSQTEYFVRGIGIGSIAASLNVENPMSGNPKADALREAAQAVVAFTHADRYLDHPDQIDALLVGSQEGVEVAFAKLEGATS